MLVTFVGNKSKRQRVKPQCRPCHANWTLQRIAPAQTDQSVQPRQNRFGPANRRFVRNPWARGGMHQRVSPVQHKNNRKFQRLVILTWVEASTKQAL